MQKIKIFEILKHERTKTLMLSKYIFRYVKNPWVLFLSYIQRDKPRKAIFRNGLEIEFDGYTQSKVYDACILFSKKYVVLKKGKDFLIKGYGITLVTPQLSVVEEIEKFYGSVKFNGKVVLDIGGFIGDTVVMFWKLGAQKIIVYEPLMENVKYIKKNVKINHINAEIYPFAVWDKDGTIELLVDDKTIGTQTFGLYPGKYKITQL